MAIFHSHVFGGSAPYEITYSADPVSTAYMSQTTTTSNRRKFTLSFWYKPGSLGASAYEAVIFSQGDGAGSQNFWFDIFDGDMRIRGNTSGVFDFSKTSNFVFSVGTWYHIQLDVDTANATAEDRVRLYIDNVRQTSWSVNTNPALNYDTWANYSVYTAYLGRLDFAGVGYLQGLISEVHFVDGLNPATTEFGKDDGGTWVPIEYTGTYGTNGYFLNFASSGAGMGTDAAGSNDYTVTGTITQSTVTPTNP